MRLIQRTTSIDFMGKSRAAIIVSLVLISVSVLFFSIRGLNLGIDFTGGTLIEIGYEKPVEIGDIRKSLENAGFDDATVQHFGSSHDVLIRLSTEKNKGTSTVSSRILEILAQDHSNKADMRRVEFVGPQVGDELVEDGGLAMIIALGAIFIYVGVFRYEKRFALGAIIALVHDVLIIIGLFSIFNLEFDLTVVAAILAVIGYSLNDTIVVYDRIRENFRKLRNESPYEVLNLSINQMLSRTLMTSITTLLVLIALFILGGEVIHNFAFALILGVVVGTYSSIYVATSAVMYMKISKSDLMPVAKEGAELDKNIP